jgi:hypothetical protein
MGWFDWFSRSRDTVDVDANLDVDHVLAEGLHDAESARQAVATLTRERKNLRNQTKLVNKTLRPISKWDTWRIARSSSGSPDLGAYQLSQAMRMRTLQARPRRFAKRKSPKSTARSMRSIALWQASTNTFEVLANEMDPDPLATELRRIVVT